MFPEIKIELAEIIYHSVSMLIAFVLALPIGWHRELSSRQMGFRTFPLVGLASCGYMLLGALLVDGDPNAQARLIQGLMTGIGFLGGGAIVKSGMDVEGTATAASIWSTAAMGAAVAFRRYEIAVLITLVTIGVLVVLTPVADYVDEQGADDAEDVDSDTGGDAG